jgi:hypothetical protein
MGLLGEFHVMHGTHLFGLSNVSQAGLEPAVAAVTVVALKFSQCGSSASGRFWSHGTQAICFCTLVAILDLSELLFSPARNCVTLELQLCLVSSTCPPPQKVEHFSFECFLLAQQISSGIHYLSCFGDSLLPCPPLSAFTAFPVFVHWEFSAESLAPSPTSILQDRFSIPPPLLLVLDYSSLFMFLSFVGVILKGTLFLVLPPLLE